MPTNQNKQLSHYYSHLVSSVTFNCQPRVCVSVCILLLIPTSDENPDSEQKNRLNEGGLVL